MGTLRTIGCILLCEAAGLVGAAFTRRSVKSWYPTLRKPSFTPPSWLFAPAWTLLYLLMGIALSMILFPEEGTASGANEAALAFFFAQLLVNAAWSFLFFGLRRPLAGLVGIVLLWCLIAATIALFWRLSPLAGALLVPYLLWVSFATLLNASIWRLNRGAL